MTVQLDRGYAAATVTQVLEMNAGSVYRYAQTYCLHGLVGYLQVGQPNYLGPTHRRSTRGPRLGLDPTKVEGVNVKPTMTLCSRHPIQANQFADSVPTVFTYRTKNTLLSILF